MLVVTRVGARRASTVARSLVVALRGFVIAFVSAEFESRTCHHRIFGHQIKNLTTAVNFVRET